MIVVIVMVQLSSENEQGQSYLRGQQQLLGDISSGDTDGLGVGVGGDG